MTSCTNKDCQNYGVQVDDNAVFCEKCGSRLASSNEQLKPAASGEEPLKTVSCRYFSFIKDGGFFESTFGISADYHGKLLIYSDRIEFEPNDTDKKNYQSQDVILKRTDVKLDLSNYGDAVIFRVSIKDMNYPKKTKGHSFTMHSISEAVEIFQLLKNNKWSI